MTPVEQHAGFYVKRDDLFEVAGTRGGKARACFALADGAVGLVTAGSRSSPQVNIVAHIGKHLGIPVRAHTPQGELSPELIEAKSLGAEIIQHKAGYNSVIIARAREDAKQLGWTNIPFGMETTVAIEQTMAEVENLPWGKFSRIVMPIGSAMSSCGVIAGLRWFGHEEVRVLGVSVGADPTKRLDKYSPDWRNYMEIWKCDMPYDKHAPNKLGDLIVDPIYEAKCIPVLVSGDLLWCVGIRSTLCG
jgi:1-aminocyclopropane-1-carboxylate deaminase/D-cysteine desulfhydrase-like pyridoxal-dependent ACC family enzyme